MGWVGEDGKHEGYMIGLVTREGTDEGGGIYRALCYPGDKERRSDIQRVQAECSCGWRSPRWSPRLWWYEPGAKERSVPSFSPYTVHVHDDDENKGYALWREHRDHEERLERLEARR